MAGISEGWSQRGFRTPVWIRLIPFFLSAVLYMSVVFSAVAPLPLLTLFAVSGFRFLALALLTNTLLVVAGFGVLPGIWFALLVGGASVVPPLLLSRRWKADRAILVTVLLILGVGALGVSGYAWIEGINPVAELRTYVSAIVDRFVEASGGASKWEIPPEEVERSMIVEFPSALAVATLVVVWMNLILFLRLNPAGIRDRLGISWEYFRTWKAPEWLVWPTIASGAILLFGAGLAADVGHNVLRCLLAVYGLQGLAVLSALFEGWGIRGGLRVLLYVLVILAMSPLLLAIGFFDLWFDFRAKLRQS